MSDHDRLDEKRPFTDAAPDETRRRLVRTMLVAPIALAVPAVLGTAAFGSRDASAALLTPTPACGDDDDDDPTPRQTEGPYFTPNSPKRTSLFERGMAGTRLLVTGMVLTRGCRPVANALVDVWQCDDAGNYDNAGYRLRGHQFTDERGVYRLETIVPGIYPGRTRHIHVKVQAPRQPILATQLYFPDERRP
jgi:protocatechuate 3,4-dioxygenase beta subunit